MLQFLQNLAKLVWPPHHSAPAEQLHVWRVGISAMTLITAGTLCFHIFVTFGAAAPFVPGFVTTSEYSQASQTWVKARTSDLRVQILDLQVSYCESRGPLAASYNERLNDKLSEYRNLGGQEIQLPDCDVVRSSQR